MSAYILNDDHLDLIVSAGFHGVGLDASLTVFHNGAVTNFNRYEDGDYIFSRLKTANYDSVNYRYKESAEPDNMKHRPVSPHLLGSPIIPWGQVLQALDCYEYQSCEHPDWEASLAHEITNRIRRKVCKIIARETDSEWEWTREHAEEIEQYLRQQSRARIEA